MKGFFVNLVKVLLSILIMFFIEEYFFKFMKLIGLHLSNTSVISLIIFIIEFILIYIIFREEISSGFSKFQNKFGSNILTVLISFLVLFVVMMISNYIIKLIAANINLTYHGLNYINVFDKEFNIDLILYIIKNIIIIPFVIVSVFVLGINNLISGKASPLIAGLVYALYEGIKMGGSFGNVFIDVIDEFILVLLLSYIYKKNSNIAFSILTFILYELFAVLLVNKIL